VSTPFRPWYRYWRSTTAQGPVAGTEEPVAAPEPVASGRCSPGSVSVERPGREAAAATFHVEHAPPPASGPGGGGDSSSATVATPLPTLLRFPSAQVLAIANQKGGVGKTTTAVSLAAALADRGLRILLIDLDPQANATSGIGLRPAPGALTLYDALVGEVPLAEVIQAAPLPNLSVAPAHIDLAGAEVELVSAFSREQRLRRVLDAVRDRYDIVLIDCPPSLGLLTVNALTAADGLVVPIQSEYYALEGLGALRRNTELIRTQLNPDLRVVGFVMTMLDARTRLSQQVVEEVQAHFGELVCATRIPRSVRLAEAPSFGQPITVFDPSSRGALAYRRLAAELLDRLEVGAEAALAAAPLGG
jgi:chromosome partitioning protein